MTALIASGVPVAGLQQVAQAVAVVFTITEKVYANKEDFQIIAHDASDLIIAIWKLQQKAEDPKKWLSPELREMVNGLAKTLNKVNEIATQQNKRNKISRIIFYMADSGKIKQLREKITMTVEKFQVLSNIKMNDLLLEVKAMQQNLSTQIENRNDAENSQQRAERVQEEDTEEEEEDTEEEEEDEPETPVMKRRTRPAAAKISPTPPIGSNISDFSFSNGGSGQIHNQNVGNVVNTNYSDVGNNHSRNYVYESPPRRSRGRGR